MIIRNDSVLASYKDHAAQDHSTNYRIRSRIKKGNSLIPFASRRLYVTLSQEMEGCTRRPSVEQKAWLSDYPTDRHGFDASCHPFLTMKGIAVSAMPRNCVLELLICETRGLTGGNLTETRIPRITERQHLIAKLVWAFGMTS